MRLEALKNSITTFFSSKVIFSFIAFTKDTYTETFSLWYGTYFLYDYIVHSKNCKYFYLYEEFLYKSILSLFKTIRFYAYYSLAHIRIPYDV